MLSALEYQALVEQAPILIWRAGTDKLCNYFNERWLHFRGKTLEQEKGNGWVEGVHPNDVARCVQTYVSSFDRRVTFEMNYRLLRHDETYRWIFDRGVPFFTEGGVFAGYIGSCIDITERIEAEEALARKQQEDMTRLKKLLPICAWCKKVRNDEGYWRDIETYFSEIHQGMTHGLCKECETRMFGGLPPQSPPKCERS